jgi:ABC-type sugar transport system ATPase subunit
MDAFAGLEIEGVSKSFGSARVLSNVSLRARESELHVLCGPPASGKSTLARIICGFESPDEGRVRVHGRDITDVDPGHREIGYVPQSFALFPHYSVGDNIAYPLRLQKVPAEKITRQVAFICEMLNISQLLEKRVDQISGGQKQRVALARGLVKSCALYVLDDPLVGLDFKLREQLVLDLRSLQKELGAGFLYLTSDPLEPLMLADSVAVLDDGTVNEVGTPVDAYLRPRTIAMANALGFPKMNTIPGKIDAAAGVLQSDLFAVPVQAGDTLPDTPVNVAVRPEAISLEPVDGAVQVDASVKLAEDLGADSVVHVETAAGLVTICHPSDDYKARYSDKERLRLWIRPQDIKIYALNTGKLLNCPIGSLAHE